MRPRAVGRPVPGHPRVSWSVLSGGSWGGGPVGGPAFLGEPGDRVGHSYVQLAVPQGPLRLGEDPAQARCGALPGDADGAGGGQDGRDHRGRRADGHHHDQGCDQDRGHGGGGDPEAAQEAHGEPAEVAKELVGRPQVVVGGQQVEAIPLAG